MVVLWNWQSGRTRRIEASKWIAHNNGEELTRFCSLRRVTLWDLSCCRCVDQDGGSADRTVGSGSTIVDWAQGTTHVRDCGPISVWLFGFPAISGQS